MINTINKRRVLINKLYVGYLNIIYLLIPYNLNKHSNNITKEYKRI